jgi:hypothetical protein
VFPVRLVALEPAGALNEPEDPVAASVKSLATFVPPLLLTTVLARVSLGWIGASLKVHVVFFPDAIVMFEMVPAEDGAEPVGMPPSMTHEALERVQPLGIASDTDCEFVIPMPMGAVEAEPLVGVSG